MGFQIMGMEVPTEKTEYRRVIQKAKTPTSSEFWKVGMIAGAGIAFVGFIGFFIFVLMSLIPM